MWRKWSKVVITENYWIEWDRSRLARFKQSKRTRQPSICQALTLKGNHYTTINLERSSRKSRTPTQQNSLTCTVSVQCTALRTVIRKVLIHWDAPMYNRIREPRLPASESYANLICLRHYDSRFLELFLRSGRWRACFLATPSSSASTSAREWRHVM